MDGWMEFGKDEKMIKSWPVAGQTDNGRFVLSIDCDSRTLLKTDGRTTADRRRPPTHIWPLMRASEVTKSGVYLFPPIICLRRRMKRQVVYCTMHKFNDNTRKREVEAEIEKTHSGATGLRYIAAVVKETPAWMSPRLREGYTACVRRNKVRVMTGNKRTD